MLKKTIIAIFIVGLSALGWKALGKPVPWDTWPDLTVKYKTTETVEGKSEVTITAVRYIRPNGDLTETQTYPEGVTQRFDVDATGRYLSGQKEAEFLGPSQTKNRKFWENDAAQRKDFAGYENFLGYRAMKFVSETQEGAVLTVLRVPELNGLEVKFSLERPDGSVTTREAVEIRKERVPDEVYGKRPDLPLRAKPQK